MLAYRAYQWRDLWRCGTVWGSENVMCYNTVDGFEILLARSKLVLSWGI